MLAILALLSSRLVISVAVVAVCVSLTERHECDPERGESFGIDWREVGGH